MTGTEIYKRTPKYDAEAATSIRLHAPEWKLLLAYDGQRGLAEVALSVGVPFSEALPLTEKFLSQGWLEEQPITLDQYLKRTGASSTSGIGSAVTPAVVLHEAKPENTPAALPASALMEETTQSFRSPDPVPASTPAPAPATTAKAPTSSGRVSAMTNTPKGPMRLKAVVDFIVSQVGNNSLGQLVVYRIFLRVPPQLLQAEDIASVHLVNDQSLVKTDSLKQAIAASVMEVMKRALPDSVFAAA